MAFHRKAAVAAVLLIGLLYGCGGGGSTSNGAGEVVAAKTLSWIPPVSYTDETPLNPATDLDSFEIYIRETGAFNETDVPLATVAAIDPVSGNSVTSFNLALLSPFLSKGTNYYVAVRAVALTGSRSDFSAPATFSL